SPSPPPSTRRVSYRSCRPVLATRLPPRSSRSRAISTASIRAGSAGSCRENDSHKHCCHARACRGHLANELDASNRRVPLDAVTPLVEIELPPGTAELAVGGDLQADLFQLADDLVDLAVLDFGKLRVRQQAARLEFATTNAGCYAPSLLAILDA